jgi:hypothetical protein
MRDIFRPNRSNIHLKLRVGINFCLAAKRAGPRASSDGQALDAGLRKSQTGRNIVVLH